MKPVPALTLLLCGLSMLPSVSNANSTRFDFRLGSRAVVTDNFYYQENIEQSNTSGLLLGSLGIAREGSRFAGALKLEAEGAANALGREDNYMDFKALTQLAYKSGLNTISLHPEFVRSHDAFGTVRTEGTASASRDLDLWNEPQLSLRWVRNGELRGSLFVDVEVGYKQRDYTTNEAFTRFLDRDTAAGSALFGFNITDKTGVYLRGIHVDVEFDDDSQGFIRSGVTSAGLLGLRWRATAKTTGRVEVGVAEREQDETGRTYDSNYWSASLDWKPLKASTITLSTERSYLASFTTASTFFDTRTYGISWKHEWNRRLATRLDAQLQDRDFVDSTRQDDTFYGAARLTYAFDQDFSGFLHMRYRDRDSNQVDRSFDRTLGIVGFEVRLN